jgi:hypothetical protein
MSPVRSECRKCSGRGFYVKAGRALRSIRPHQTRDRIRPFHIPSRHAMRIKDPFRATPQHQNPKNNSPVFPEKTPTSKDLVRKKRPNRAPPTGPSEAHYALAKPNHHPASSPRALRLRGPSSIPRPNAPQTTPNAARAKRTHVPFWHIQHAGASMSNSLSSGKTVL